MHTQWTERKEQLREDLLAWLGDLPNRPEPVITEIWRREFATHTEIKLQYPDEAGEPVPAYLLKPRNPIRSPLPAILALHQCGHLCDIGKEQVVGKCADLPEQAYGLDLVRRGFLVLAPDAKNVGERYNPNLREPWQRVRDFGGQHFCCLGTGGSWAKPHWKRVSDVMSAIDLLSSLPEADPDRIGMIGFSLGADTILWAMPFEPRVKAASISCGGVFKNWNPDDWNPYALAYADVLKILAPRPIYLTMGIEDPINYLDENEPADSSPDELLKPKRRAHEAAEDHYRSLGAAKKFRVSEFPGGHEFPEVQREEAYAWLEKWLVEH